VFRVGRLPVVVERMQRPELAVAQRRVRVARDRPDRRLRGGRAPCALEQRLVDGRVEQRDGDATCGTAHERAFVVTSITERVFGCG
jgi:hypothetical protein